MSLQGYAGSMDLPGYFPQLCDARLKNDVRGEMFSDEESIADAAAFLLVVDPEKDDENDEIVMQQKHCVQLLRDMNGLRQSSSLCDVVLVIDGQEFPAHRSVLASGCPYFKCMFDSSRPLNVTERQQEHVKITNLPVTVMDDVLSYIYTGGISKDLRTQEHCYDALITSDFLLLENLKSSIASWMTKNVNPDNCILWLHIANSLNCQELRARALETVWVNFEHLSSCYSEEFAKLDYTLLSDIISSNLLDAENEAEVFKALVSWTKKKQLLQEHFVDLFKHIRIQFLNEEYLQIVVLTEDLVKSFPECLDYIAEERNGFRKDGRFSYVALTTENLIRNPNFFPNEEWQGGVCEEFDTEPWIEIVQGGNGYRLEKKPQGSKPIPGDAGGNDSWCVVGSYGSCRRTQLVNLQKAADIPGRYIDVYKPHIYVCVWAAQRSDCSAHYTLDVDLLAEDGITVLGKFSVHNEILEGKGNSWVKVEHTFSDYPPGVRFVRWVDSSRDKGYWAGFYGAKIVSPTVRIFRPKDGKK